VVNEPDRTRFDEDAGPAGAFRLRGEAPPVMRLSRRVLTGLVGIGAIVIFAALIFALSQGSRRSGGGPELYNTDNKTTPDGLTSLPRDYGGLTPDKPLPEIPPSPGDAGRPQPMPGLDAPEQQRLAQENEAARLSRLFATTGTRERPAEAAPRAPAADTKTAPGQSEAAPLDPGALLNMQDRKLAFVNGPVDRKTVSPDHLENPLSRYVVQAGSVIAAALITGMRSDLPGEVTAQVTENVYDSPTGRKAQSSSAAMTARSPSDRTACSWCGRGCSCRTAAPSYWNASPRPTGRASSVSKTRSISIGAGSSWGPRCRP
jgi:type IV secretion system protein TrbI